MTKKNTTPITPNNVRESTCPACGYHVAISFLRDSMPLALIAWPKTVEDAEAMPKLDLDYVRCIDCGHIYNSAFDHNNVPYSEEPNLMYNAGTNWAVFIREIQKTLISRLPKNPTVVEIGHGDGSFLSTLAEMNPDGRYIGFDLHGIPAVHGPVEFRAELFDPMVHFAELKPDLIATRHVMEHLTNPLGFLQRLGFAAGQSNLNPLAYIEVPCVDRILQTGRTTDFYYEHGSQFTTRSFYRMLEGCGAEVHDIGHGYEGEVVFGVMRVRSGQDHGIHAQESITFLNESEAARATGQKQLADMVAAGRTTAVWGGRGKSSAFINRYGLDRDRFPLVVDSDINKVGTFVTGTGQEIRYRDVLKESPVDIVIIPPQWRARDIVAEMKAEGISPQSVLIEFSGSLVEFDSPDHPY